MVDSVSYSAAGSSGNVAPRGGMCWHGRRSCSPSTASSRRRQNIVTGDFSGTEKAPEVGFLLSASLKPCATSSLKVFTPALWRNTLHFYFFFFYCLWHFLGPCGDMSFDVVKDAPEIKRTKLSLLISLKKILFSSVANLPTFLLHLEYSDPEWRFFKRATGGKLTSKFFCCT